MFCVGRWHLSSRPKVECAVERLARVFWLVDNIILYDDDNNNKYGSVIIFNTTFANHENDKRPHTLQVKDIQYFKHAHSIFMYILCSNSDFCRNLCIGRSYFIVFYITEGWYFDNANFSFSNRTLSPRSLLIIQQIFFFLTIQIHLNRNQTSNFLVIYNLDGRVNFVY